MRRIILMAAGCMALWACSDRDPGGRVAGDIPKPAAGITPIVQYCEAVIDNFTSLSLPGGDQPLVHAAGYPCPVPLAVSIVATMPTSQPEKFVIGGDVLFGFDTAAIKESEYGELERIAEQLKRNPEARIDVDGYTDGTGAAAYNLKLSERRAQAIRVYLADAGVPVSATTARGFGKADPVAANTTAEGRARNRRVEIISR